MGSEMKLKQDPERIKEGFRDTGIFVRAQNKNGKWETTDIVHLDSQSLLEWLRSRGGQNVWAEETVGILLGHPHSLHAETVQATDTPPRAVKPVASNFIDDVHQMLEAYVLTSSLPCQRTGVHMYPLESDICYWCKEERKPEGFMRNVLDASKEKDRITSGYPKWCGKCGATISQPGPCPTCDDNP